MKSHVAIYSTREKALEALESLNAMRFPMENVSLIGKEEIINDHIKIKSLEDLEITPMLVCIGSGVFIGILSGRGLIAIPGFSFLPESGVLIASLLGFDIGLIAGIFGTVIATVITKKAKVKYQERLVGKKFMVVVNGSLEEVEKAEQILHTEGIHYLNVA
jgi:hypothetical protein